MKLSVIISAVVMSVVFTGCAFVTRPFYSEDSLLDKAEFAIGIPKSDLTIVKDSIVTTGLYSIEYRVNDKKGNLYRCAFDSTVIMDSTSACRKIDASGKSYNEFQIKN